MWKTLENNNTLYLFKFESNPLRFYLTDLKELWLEEIETEQITSRFKDLNPLLNSAEVVKELNALCNNIQSDGVSIQFIENCMAINLECIVDNFKIKFKWNLNKCSNDVFFKEITLNLISTVITLENRQKELFYLLEKKDKEKNEYIREYGEISRGFLKTIKFNKDEFLGESSNCGLFNIFSEESVINNLKDTHGAKIEKRKIVCTDDKGVKKVKKYIPKFLKGPKGLTEKISKLERQEIGQ